MKNFIQQCKDKIKKTLPLIKKLTKKETWLKIFLPENPQEHKRMVRFFFLIIFLVMVIIGLMFLLSFFVLKSGSPRVRVPNVTDTKILEAIQEIQDKNLKVEFEMRFDDKNEIYTVIQQQPRGGIVSREGRSVKLTVSLGKDLYIVPKINGLTKTKALEILSEQKIPYNIQTVKSESNTHATVIGLDHKPGTQLDRSNPLTVTIAENQTITDFIIENYVNQSIEFVVTTLFNNKINPVIISRTVDSANLDGIILEQNIEAHTVLKKNSNLIITVGIFPADESEKEKLRWHAINYYIPRPNDQGTTSIEITEDGQTNEILENAPTAKFYKAVLEDELGTRRTIYERLGSEGTSFVRIFKSFGKSIVRVYADTELIGERNYGE